MSVFRSEPHARLSCDERSRPDPSHRGISILDRSYSLVTGDGEEIHLQPGTGEAVLVSQAERPALVAEAGGRYWWMYEDRLYSAAEWLSRATVANLVNGKAIAEAPERSRSLRDRLSGKSALSLTPPAGLMPILSDLAPFVAI